MIPANCPSMGPFLGDEACNLCITSGSEQLKASDQLKSESFSFNRAIETKSKIFRPPDCHRSKRA